MDTEGAASHAFVDRLFCRIAGATSVYGVGMYDITLNEWFRHLAVCDAQNAGRRVTRSATKKKKPGGGPGSGTMPVKPETM